MDHSVRQIPASDPAVATTVYTPDQPRLRILYASSSQAQLRTELQLWLEERPAWPGAQTTPALLLNRRSGRLSVRGASGIIAGIATAAGLDNEAITAHVARHTFATTLIRGGTDLVVVADLLGHARLDTVRAYTRPTADDRIKALNLLPTDR
jgi:integrase/recombinase XerC